ncbi:hypothetical protein SeMB42_g07170 [Synchytrium endobioticum]|nr:hypothetical protein SeMB42_g07170 [Synchytrium endobioticum]
MAAANAKIVWDGRLKPGFNATDFDSNKTEYNPAYTRPNIPHVLKWSDILEFSHAKCLFDPLGTSVEVILKNHSVTAFGEKNIQYGFRRTELLPKPMPNNTLYQGIKTFYWSMTPTKRLANLTYDHVPVFLETTTGTHIFDIHYGSPYNWNKTADSAVLSLMSSSTAGYDKVQSLFSVPFTAGVIQNFAVTVNFDKATLQAYHSTDDQALKEVVKPIANPVGVVENIHYGLLRLPLATAADMVHNGYQEPNLEVSVKYCGLFILDGPAVLQPPLA